MVKFINISVNFSGGKIHPFRVFEILLKSGFTSYCHWRKDIVTSLPCLLGHPARGKYFMEIPTKGNVHKIHLKSLDNIFLDIN